MDERILAILKAVANVDYATAGDNDDPYCLFCASDTSSGNPKDVDDPHESACPVVLARRILAEQRTPLKVWRVEVDTLNFFDETVTQTVYRTEYTEEAMRAWFSGNDRRVRVTFVREVRP